jgi:L-lactate dehydrogenase complex protein LldF
MNHITTEHYKAEARKAIKDRVLQSALASVQDRLGKGTAKAYRELPEGPGLRRTAHDMRMQAVENLDILLSNHHRQRPIENPGGHRISRNPVLHPLCGLPQCLSGLW